MLLPPPPARLFQQSPIEVTPKSNGTLPICTDCAALNVIGRCEAVHDWHLGGPSHIRWQGPRCGSASTSPILVDRFTVLGPRPQEFASNVVSPSRPKGWDSPAAGDLFLEFEPCDPTTFGEKALCSQPFGRFADITLEWALRSQGIRHERSTRDGEA